MYVQLNITVIPYIKPLSCILIKKCLQIEMNPNKAGVGPQSICNAIQVLGGRLTHLILAHNRLGGIPQIIAALSVS